MKRNTFSQKDIWSVTKFPKLSPDELIIKQKQKSKQYSFTSSLLLRLMYFAFCFDQVETSFSCACPERRVWYDLWKMLVLLSHEKGSWMECIRVLLEPKNISLSQELLSFVRGCIQDRKRLDWTGATKTSPLVFPQCTAQVEYISKRKKRTLRSLSVLCSSSSQETFPW